MTAAAVVLQVRRLRAARGVTVATEVALTASPGEVIAVEGPNGAGKTTLLAAAAGLLPGSGRVVRPSSVGYAPERASALPRVPVSRWLTGLARTAGLSRRESAARAAEVLDRLGLASSASRPVNVLSRGNTQRALVAQAVVGEPALLILDEPSGGMDDDGVTRLAAEIQRAADRNATVLVARHPTAPLPLPAGSTWRFQHGTIAAVPRAMAPAVQHMLVETGDGVIRHVPAAALPAVLRAALEAGIPIRRVQPAPPGPPPRPTVSLAPWHPQEQPDAAAAPAALPVQRAGTAYRLLFGAAHRARLLAASQWFFAPTLVFLAVLAIIYSGSAGAALQTATITAIVLVPVMTWMAMLAHRVDGRELARAFAAHVGGRQKAHLATDLGLVPYAAGLTGAAIIWPLVSQGGQPHPAALVARMVALHLAAALFGTGVGSLLVLIERFGWRMIATVAVYLGLLVLSPTPMTPLLKLATTSTSTVTPVASQAAWLAAAGAVLVAAAAGLSARVS